jgi:hypothetical protein
MRNQEVLKKKGDVLIIPLHKGKTELNKLKNFDFLAFRLQNDVYCYLVFKTLHLAKK